MIYETKRLKLVLLSGLDLKNWIINLPHLEEKIGCKYDADSLDEDFKKIILSQSEKCLSDEKNTIWNSFFWIILKSSNKVIGSIDFKCVPENKIVEIGYGLGKQYEGNGYMSESVKAMIEIAKEKELKKVIADTLKSNQKSQNVLLRNGFALTKEDDEYFYYELKL